MTLVTRDTALALLRLAIEHGGDATVLRVAVSALGRQWTDSAELLGAALSAAEPTVYALQRFADHLGTLGQFEALARLASHRSPDIRLQVARTFARCGNDTHVPVADAARAQERSDKIVAAWADAAAQMAQRAAADSPVEACAEEAPVVYDELRLHLLLDAPVDWRDAAALVAIHGDGSPLLQHKALAALRSHSRSALVAVTDALDRGAGEHDGVRLWQLLIDLDAEVAIARAKAGIEQSQAPVSVLVPMIARSGDEKSAALLVRAMLLVDATARRPYRDALGVMGPVGYLAFLRAFRHDQRLRTGEAPMLAKLGGELAIEPLIDGLLDEASEPVRRNCAAALQPYVAHAIEPLGRAMRVAGPQSKRLIVGLLASTQHAKALGLLLALAESPAIDERAMAVQAMGGFTDPSAVAAVLDASISEHEALRAASADAARWLDSDQFMALARRLAIDASPLVRQRTLEAIARRPADHSVGGIREQMTRLLVELLAADWSTSELARETLVRVADDSVLSRAIDEAERMGSETAGVLAAIQTQRSRARSWDSGRGESFLTDHAPAAQSAGSSWYDSGLRSISREKPPPPKVTDQTYFCVTAPVSVAPAASALLNLWAYLGAQRATVLQRASEEAVGVPISRRSVGPSPVERGTTLGVQVDLPTLGYRDTASLVWGGRISNCAFMVPIPAHPEPGNHVGSVQILVQGLRIARVFFDLMVGAPSAATKDRTLHEQRVSRAFASYASEDRGRVLGRIQGMQKIIPDIDIFLDVVALRSGQDWKQRIAAEISERDVFYLFWSATAARSTWVDYEWRTALKCKGMEAIDPVPLEPPDKAPPPAELAGLHFNDWTLQIRDATGLLPS